MTTRKLMPTLILLPLITEALVFSRHALAAKFRLFMALDGTGRCLHLSLMKGLATRFEMCHSLVIAVLRENFLNAISNLKVESSFTKAI